MESLIKYLPAEVVNISFSYRNRLKEAGVLHHIARLGLLKEIRALSQDKDYFQKEIGCKAWYYLAGRWWEDNPFPHNVEFPEPIRRVVPRCHTRYIVPVIKYAVLQHIAYEFEWCMWKWVESSYDWRETTNFFGYNFNQL